MSSCAICADLLPDLVDGKPDPILARRLFEKMETCEKCRHCVEAYKKTASLCQQSNLTKVVPSEPCEHLLDALRGHLHK